MQITTPSGYIVTLKEKLAFGETRKLQKLLVAGEKVEIVDGKPQQPKIDMGKAMDYADKAMAFLVVEIRKGDVVITTDIEKEIFNWPSEDGDAVMSEVDKIVNPQITAEMATQEKKTS